MKNNQIEILLRFCKTIDIICADMIKDTFRVVNGIVKLNDEKMKLIKYFETQNKKEIN